jgi:hypothetical protein
MTQRGARATTTGSLRSDCAECSSIVLPCKCFHAITHLLPLYLVVSGRAVSRCLVVLLYLVIFRCISFSRCVSLHLALSCAERCRAESSAILVALSVPASGIMPVAFIDMLILPCKCFHATTHLLPLYSISLYRGKYRGGLYLVVLLCSCISLYLVFSLCLVASRAFFLCSDRGSEPLRSSWAYHRQYHGRGSWVAHFPDP